MPGLTGKQEAFAQAVASGKSQADAYRAAYGTAGTPKTQQEGASRLAANSKVRARIDELRAPAVAAAGMTLEQHLRDLQIMRNKALKMGQISAAIQAEIARGRASGILAAEKKVVEVVGKDGGPIQTEARIDVSACTEEELRALARLPIRAS